MVVVIQCAARKHEHAGYFRSQAGEKVFFVANPDMAPPAHALTVAHPDALAHDGVSWREQLVAYNKRGDNPFGLARASALYENRAYAELVSALGPERVFILSAGWGLLRSDFLTPQYDITFSSAVRSKQPWKYRGRSDRYDDFRQLPDDTTEPVVFLGGKDYVNLFCELTQNLQAERTIFYNSSTPPRAPGCRLQLFETRTRTNWHYECARWFLRRNT